MSQKINRPRQSKTTSLQVRHPSSKDNVYLLSWFISLICSKTYNIAKPTFYRQPDEAERGKITASETNFWGFWNITPHRMGKLYTSSIDRTVPLLLGRPRALSQSHSALYWSQSLVSCLKRSFVRALFPNQRILSLNPLLLRTPNPWQQKTLPAGLWSLTALPNLNVRAWL